MMNQVLHDHMSVASSISGCSRDSSTLSSPNKISVNVSSCSYTLSLMTFQQLQPLSFKIQNGIPCLETSPVAFEMITQYLEFKTLPTLINLSDAELNDLETMASKLQDVKALSIHLETSRSTNKQPPSPRPKRSSFVRKIKRRLSSLDAREMSEIERQMMEEDPSASSSTSPPNSIVQSFRKRLSSTDINSSKHNSSSMSSLKELTLPMMMDEEPATVEATKNNTPSTTSSYSSSSSSSTTSSTNGGGPSFVQSLRKRLSSNDSNSKSLKDLHATTTNKTSTIVEEENYGPASLENNRELANLSDTSSVGTNPSRHSATDSTKCRRLFMSVSKQISDSVLTQKDVPARKWTHAEWCASEYVC